MLGLKIGLIMLFFAVLWFWLTVLYIRGNPLEVKINYRIKQNVAINAGSALVLGIVGLCVSVISVVVML